MRPVVHVNPVTGEVVRSKVLRHTPCGKQAYSSRKVAKATAKAQAKLMGEDIRAYHCDRGCHAWHLGHPPRSRSSAA